VEPTRRRITESQASVRRGAGTLAVAFLLIFTGFATPHGVEANGRIPARHTREHFRKVMPQTVRADHPGILPVAAAIRAITTDPLEQIVVVNDVTHLLVDYDDDERVWGWDEYHATFDEMLARRRQAGWLYLRDDCDGRAVVAAHLLAALGIPWRLEASYWKEHAWVVAKVNGVEYDLLDLRKNAPEMARLSYRLFGRHFVRPSVRPPTFAWRRAWAERTGRDLTIGLQLGMLMADSTPMRLRERYSTDWTVRAPGGNHSPIETRAGALAVAGFPYGEPLYMSAGAIAAATAPANIPATVLGVPTSDDAVPARK
jgi:hypothetical protein